MAKSAPGAKPAPTFPVTIEHWRFDNHGQCWVLAEQIVDDLPARARRSTYDTARLAYEACFAKRLDKRANYTIWTSRTGVVYLTIWEGRGRKLRQFRLIITPWGEPADEPCPAPVLEFEETSST